MSSHLQLFVKSEKAGLRRCEVQGYRPISPGGSVGTYSSTRIQGSHQDIKPANCPAIRAALETEKGRRQTKTQPHHPDAPRHTTYLIHLCSQTRGFQHPF